MKLYKKNYELKDAAKDLMDGRYGKTILLFLLSSLITGSATLLVNAVASVTMSSVYYGTDSVAAATAVSLIFDAILAAANIVCAVMNAGIALYFLNMACGRPFYVTDLFYAYKNDSKKALTVAAALTLCQVVCLWPGQYCLQFFYNTGDRGWLAYGAAAFAVGLCVYFPLYTGIALSFYLMLDFPENSGRETLRLCRRVMKGHRRRFFLLLLSFLPLMILCVLSFGIGFLWLNPYMELSCACFFLDLMNPREVAAQPN